MKTHKVLKYHEVSYYMECLDVNHFTAYTGGGTNYGVFHKVTREANIKQFPFPHIILITFLVILRKCVVMERGGASLLAVNLGIS